MTQRRPVARGSGVARTAIHGVRCAACAALVFALAAAVHASPTSVDADPPGKYDPPLAELTGEQIYQRVLDNRFDAYEQTSLLLSGDKAGNDQETRLKMWFQSFRGPDRAAVGLG